MGRDIYMIYSLSNEIKEIVDKKVKLVLNEYSDLLEYEEFIAMPDYGEIIIIRFKLKEVNSLSLDDLDKLETQLRKLVGNEFWVNLMGNTYQKYSNGVSFSEAFIYANQCMESLDFKNHEVYYRDNLKKDKEFIKKSLGLDGEQTIWEIQPSSLKESLDGYVLIVDKINSINNTEEICKIGKKHLKITYLNRDDDFCGLIKLYNKAVLEKTSVFSQILSIDKKLKGNYKYVIM